MSKKILPVVGILLVLGIILAACAVTVPAPASPAEQPAAPADTQPSAEEPAQEEALAEETAPQAAQEPVYLGALLPLSEPGAPQAGQLILRGIELGAEYVNTVLGGTIDGRPVEIVVEDDKGTPEVGASGYRRLVQEKNVAGVTGCYHSSVCLATVEVAKELGVPVIITQGSNAAITETGYPQVFRTHLIDTVRATALVDFAKNNGYQKIAIVADNTDFGVGLTGEVEKQGAAAGLEVKPMIYDKTAVDLTPELLEVQAWGPDILFNGGTGNPEHLIIDQAYEIGLFPDVPMLATSDWPYRSDEYWNLHPDTGTGMYIVTAYHKAMELTEMGKWFQEAYREQYDEDPTYSSFNGFGDAVILAEAVKRAGTTDPEKVVEALESGEFEFWAGTVTFPKGEGALWHQWTPPVLITQYTEPNQTQDEAELIYTFNYKPE